MKPISRNPQRGGTLLSRSGMVRSRHRSVPSPWALLTALILLTAPTSFAGAPASSKAVVIPATPAPFIPPPLFGDWTDPEPSPITGEEGNRKSVAKRVPPVVTSYGPFKIGENESPLPQDRVFLTYNFYTEVLGSDFHRETLGFEKTILGGEASLGLRVPFSQFRGDFEIDDLSLIYKHKLLHRGGFTLSGGMAVTIPVNPYEPVQGGGDKYSCSTTSASAGTVSAVPA